MRKVELILEPLVIVLVCLLVYSHSFSTPFVLDDRRNILQNASALDPSHVGAIWNYVVTRATAQFTFAINYRLDGLNVTGYHITNLIIHILTALSVWWLLRLLLHRRSVIPVLSAVFFAIHPVQTETVLYITQRCALLSALFYLLTLIFYIQSERTTSKSRLFYCLSLCTMFLAFLSKENSFSLPLAVTLVTIYFLPKRNTLKQILNAKIISYFVITGLVASGIFLVPFLHFGIHGIGGKSDTPLFTYLLTEIHVIRTYIRLLLFPINQNFDYEYPLTTALFTLPTIVSLLLHGGLFCVSYIVRKRNHFISFGILFFYLTLSIESFIPLNDVLKEHTLYLPSVGYFLVFSSLCVWIYENVGVYVSQKNIHKMYKYTSVLLLVLLLFVYGITAYRRTLVWQTEVSLWNDVILKSPNKDRPRIQLGIMYFLKGNLEESKHQFETLLKNNPNNLLGYSNLSVIYIQQQNFQKAYDILTTALQIDNSSQMLWQNLAYLHETKGDTDLAMQAYQSGLSQKTTDNEGLAITYTNFGTLYVKQDKWDLALEQFQNAIQKDPTFARAHYSLGLAYIHFGKKREAKEELSEALRLEPAYKQAQIYLEKLK